MKSRLPKRQPGAPEFAAFLVHCCDALDKMIPVLRTLFLVAGVVASGLGAGIVADFLFVTGLVFQFAIWFEQWWVGSRCP